MAPTSDTGGATAKIHAWDDNEQQASGSVKSLSAAELAAPAGVITVPQAPARAAIVAPGPPA
ncbi:MAG: hypothetical protein U0414_19605 [Polyangiaceae bacterium]